jgi:hypothetical protein
MELKPELQKTIKRLVSQKNYDVLKNKLRNWIVAREVNIGDLIRQCREKTLFVPPIILNKIGMLFSSGKEGVNEDSDTAFMFYLIAADLGYPSANGNVASYYFNGRAPGGKNVQLAYQYCRKAIELGCDKFILMSEILHEQQDYLETIRYVRKMLDNKHYSKTVDAKKKMDIRKLEINCLHEEMRNRIFIKLFLNYHKTLLIDNILQQQEIAPNNSTPLKYFSYNFEKTNYSKNGGNPMMMKSISGDEEVFDFNEDYFNQATSISSPGAGGGGGGGPQPAPLPVMEALPTRPKSPAVVSPMMKRTDSERKMPSSGQPVVTIPTAPVINTAFSISIDNNNNSQLAGPMRSTSPSMRQSSSHHHHHSPMMKSSPSFHGKSTSSLLMASLNSPKVANHPNQMMTVSSTTSPHSASKQQLLSNSLTMNAPHYHPQNYRQLASNPSDAMTAKDKAVMLYKQSLHQQNQLPGWYFITEELEGFDANSCLELTAKAEMLTLESEVMKSAAEYAKSYLSIQLPMKNPLFAQQQQQQHSSFDTTGPNTTSALLQSSFSTAANSAYHNNLFQNMHYLNSCLTGKLGEFQAQSQQLAERKNTIMKLWNSYTDVQEHILRKQILTEKKFFNPLRNINVLTFLLSKELLHRRLYDYNEYLNPANLYQNLFISLNEYCNEPLMLVNLANKYGAKNSNNAQQQQQQFPHTRMMLVAERSLLELSIDTYGRSSLQHKEKTTSGSSSSPSHGSSLSHHHKASPGQRTGWTGRLNQYICDLEDTINHENNLNSSSTASSNKTTKDHLLSENTYLETVVIGSSVIRYNHKTYPMLSEPNAPQSAFQNHIPSLRGNHQSFVVMEDIHNSTEILQFFNKLTMVSSPAAILTLGDHYDIHFLENERKLVDIIFKFTQDGKPIALNELQNMNEDITEYDCNHLMKICYFYFVKRLIPWILSIDPSVGNVSSLESLERQPSEDSSNNNLNDHHLFHTRVTHELPLATAQARALQLVKFGFLTFQELFELSSPYGIFYFDNSLPKEASLASKQAASSAAEMASSPMRSEVNNNDDETTTIVSPTKKSSFVVSSTSSTSNTSLPRKKSFSSLSSPSTTAVKQEGNTSNSAYFPPPPPPSASKTTSTNTAATTTTSSTPGGGGVFQTFDLLRQQIININELYQKAILESSIDNYHPFIQFFKNHPQGKTIPSYRLLKQELLFCYGGEGDSDDEGVGMDENDEDVNNINNINNTKKSQNQRAITTTMLGKLENNDYYGSEDRILELLMSQLRV